MLLRLAALIEYGLIARYYCISEQAFNQTRRLDSISSHGPAKLPDRLKQCRERWLYKYRHDVAHDLRHPEPNNIRARSLRRLIALPCRLSGPSNSAHQDELSITPTVFGHCQIESTELLSDSNEVQDIWNIAANSGDPRLGAIAAMYYLSMVGEIYVLSHDIQSRIIAGLQDLARNLTERYRHDRDVFTIGPEDRTACTLTALHLCERFGFYRLANRLSEFHAGDCGVKHLDMFRCTALHIRCERAALTRAQNFDFMRCHESASTDVDAFNMLPIHVAAASGNLAAVELLQSMGPLGVAYNFEGCGVLSLACYYGSSKVVDYVLDQAFGSVRDSTRRASADDDTLHNVQGQAQACWRLTIAGQGTLEEKYFILALLAAFGIPTPPNHELSAFTSSLQCHSLLRDRVNEAELRNNEMSAFAEYPMATTSGQWSTSTPAMGNLGMPLTPNSFNRPPNQINQRRGPLNDLGHRPSGHEHSAPDVSQAYNNRQTLSNPDLAQHTPGCMNAVPGSLGSPFNPS